LQLVRPFLFWGRCFCSGGSH